jgi:hypothetical protein
VISSLRLIVGVLVWLAAGRGVLRLAGANSLPFGPVARPFAWLLAGVAAGGFLTSTLGVLGLPVRAFPLTAPILIAVAVAGGPCAWPRWSDPRRWSSRRRIRAASDIAPAVVTIALAVPVLATAAVQRVTMNDEYGIWALKARMLYLYGHLNTYLWTADPSYDYSHRDYPLLVSSVPLWGYSWIGHQDERVAHLLVSLVTVAGLVVAVRLIQLVAGGPAATVTALSFGAVQGLASQATWLLADTTTMAYCLCLVVSLVLMCAADSPDVTRAALGFSIVLAVAGVLTKNEGAAFTLAALLAALLVAPASRRRLLLAPAAGAVLSLLPWSAWVRLHGIHSDVVSADTLGPGSLVHHLGRLGPLLAEISRLWPGPAGWPLMAVTAATVGALVAAPARRRVVAQLTLAFLLTMAVLVGTYLVAPFTGTAYWLSNLPRVLLLPAVLAWTLGAVAATSLLTRSTRRRIPDRPDPDAWVAATPRTPMDVSTVRVQSR